MSIVLAVLLSGLAAVWDARTGRIPNWLTLSGLALGLAGQCVARGAAGAVSALLGVVLCAVVPGVMFQASRGRAIGGGDVKLFAALGAALGPLRGLEVEFSSFLLLGTFALFQLAYRGDLWRVLLNSLALVCNPVLPRRLRRTVAPAAMTMMKMGPAIALSFVVVLAKDWFMGTS